MGEVMRFKLVSAVAALVIALSGMGAGAVRAVYVKACGTVYPSIHLHSYINANYGYLINHMQATTNVVDPLACTGGGPGTSGSFDLPVNMQGQSPGKDFVQLGFGRYASGHSLRWLYTPSGTSGGLLAEATGLGIGNPIFGRQYQFTVSVIGVDWQYSIKDLSTGIVSSFFGSGSTLNDNEAWAGFELVNFNDQLGGQEASGEGSIHDVATSAVGSSTLNYLTFDTSSFIIPVPPGLQSYYRSSAFYQSGNSNRSVIWAYTKNHT
jgi:hypothetical protein